MCPFSTDGVLQSGCRGELLVLEFKSLVCTRVSGFRVWAFCVVPILYGWCSLTWPLP